MFEDEVKPNLHTIQQKYPPRHKIKTTVKHTNLKHLQSH